MKKNHAENKGSIEVVSLINNEVGSIKEEDLYNPSGKVKHRRGEKVIGQVPMRLRQLFTLSVRLTSQAKIKLIEAEQTGREDKIKAATKDLHIAKIRAEVLDKAFWGELTIALHDELCNGNGSESDRVGLTIREHWQVVSLQPENPMDDDVDGGALPAMLQGLLGLGMQANLGMPHGFPMERSSRYVPYDGTYGGDQFPGLHGHHLPPHMR